MSYYFKWSEEFVFDLCQQEEEEQLLGDMNLREHSK